MKELKDILVSENALVYRNGCFKSLGLIGYSFNDHVLTFIEDEKYIQEIDENISCIICKKELTKIIERKFKGGIIVSDNPRVEYFSIHNNLSEDKLYIRKKNKTEIGKGAKISKFASINEFNVVIGENVIIEDFVVIEENTVIGDNCIIRSGAKLGSEGFEFKRVSGNEIMAVKHLGGVIINNNVEIQYNTCIDKAVYPWDNTIIGEYCKIDNLVHIGHAVKLGEGCMVAANSLIGGRTEIGEKSWIGISATISNGLVIGERAKINIGSVVTKNIEKDNSVSGNFAIDHSKFIKFIKSIR